MQKHSTHKNTSGFTLIELLIVITIIGILAAIAIPQFNQYKIRGYDAHSKQALHDMHLLCNAYWLDTDSTQGCDLPKIKEVTYGFNQNPDVVATLPPSPLDNFCASAKHNSSPNTYSIDSASLVSDTGDCGKGRAEIQLAAAEQAEFEKTYRSCGNDWEEYKKYGGARYLRYENSKTMPRPNPETFLPIEFMQLTGSIYGWPEGNDDLYGAEGGNYYVPDTPVLGFCFHKYEEDNRDINDRQIDKWSFRIPGCREVREAIIDIHPQKGNVWGMKEVPCQKSFDNNISGGRIEGQGGKILLAQGLNTRYQDELKKNGKESADQLKEKMFQVVRDEQKKQKERFLQNSYNQCKRRHFSCRPNSWCEQQCNQVVAETDESYSPEYLFKGRFVHSRDYSKDPTKWDFSTDRICDINGNNCSPPKFDEF